MRHTIAILLTVVVLGGCSGGSSKAAKAKPRVATTTVVFTGRDSQRFCALDAQFHAHYDQAFATPSSTPPAQLATSYQAALTALEDMEKAASDEIKPAVTQMRTTTARLLPLLAQAGYDPNRLNAEGTTIVKEPATKQAADRLGRYEQQVCKRPASG